MPAIFAFDFSMIKPAMCAYIDGKILFYVWSAHIDQNSQKGLEEHNIIVKDRGLEKISKMDLDESELILEHVTRAVNLADMICSDIDYIVELAGINKEDVIIANEGFAFAAKGDAVLDLSGYKYILMYALMQSGYKNFRTYSPIVIKSVANCAKRGMTKDDVVKALGNEPSGIHDLIDTIRENPGALKKKTSWLTCIDDLADSYWCLRTTLKKENIDCKLNQNG